MVPSSPRGARTLNQCVHCFGNDSSTQQVLSGRSRWLFVHFSCSVQSPVNCGMWDLVSQPGQHPVDLQGSLSGMFFGPQLSPPAGHLSWTQQPVNLLITATAIVIPPWTPPPPPPALTHSSRGSFLWTLQKSLLSTGRMYLEASQMNSQLSPAHSPAVVLGNSFLLALRVLTWETNTKSGSVFLKPQLNTRITWGPG